jgi:hypothetical protein
MCGLAGIAGSGLAAETSAAGNWIVTVLPPGQEISLWIVQIEDAGGVQKASLLSAVDPRAGSATVTTFMRKDNVVHLTLQVGTEDFAFVVYGSEKEASPARLLGSLELHGKREFARLERTEEKRLDPQKFRVVKPGLRDLNTASRLQDAKQRLAAFKEIMEKNSGEPLAYYIGLELLRHLPAAGAAEAEIREQSEKIISLATAYGPEMKLHATHLVAQQLVGNEKLAGLALGYALQAEKLLDTSTPPATQVLVLRTLAAALRKSNKTDEAAQVAARLSKLNRVLDEEFAKTSIPFAPEPSAARLGKSNRVVLLELFTGSQCPPCVAADVAFDALLQAYKPADLVLLQYHLHVPRADPLTNADAEDRGRYYDIPGTPMVFIDGKPFADCGGLKTDAKQRYDALVKLIDEGRERSPKGQLELSARRAKSEITVAAQVSDLKKTGDKIRLRVVLVEKVVSYAGTNGQRLHHHVVRAFLGGAAGLPLKEASAKQELKLNLETLTSTLQDYLVRHKFPDEDRPLDLKHLKIIAFVQDDESKEVFQATQVDLPE